MKKFFGIIAIAAVATAAGWNFNQSQNEVELSDLALANVEALATPETDEEFTGSTDCYATWCNKTCRIHTKASTSKCYCSECS